MCDKLVKILDNEEIFEGRDSAGITSILKYILKLNNYKIILYGVGDWGYYKLFWLRKRGIEPIYVVDNDYVKNGDDFWGIKIIHTTELIEAIQGLNVAAVICTTWENLIEQRNIYKILISSGIKDIYYFNLDNFQYGLWAHYYAKNKNKLIEFYDNLIDDDSKNAFVEYIRAVMHDDFYRGPSIETSKKYLGDGVFEWLLDESIINCGMAMGDTIFHMVSENKPFKTVYGIETSKQACFQAKKYLRLLPESIYKKVKILNMTITEKNTFDFLFKEEFISLICLDVEGVELEVLKGAEEIIKNQSPVLAISIYHKKEDFVDIPNYINSIVKNYMFFLRKYVPWRSIVSKDELVLYAVPTSRIINYKDHL